MNCRHVHVMQDSEFDTRFFETADDRRIPIDGTVELTFRCNLKCQHCYCNLPPGDKDAIIGELTTDEVFHLLDEIAAAGCLWLLITGGEPLLRKDFLEIYTYAKKKGFLITLFTNGTLLTPELADHLVKWPPLRVELTLYGASAETHDGVTGVAGSFEGTEQGIHLLLNRGIPFGLKTMVMTLNRHELSGIQAYARSLGAGFHFDAILNPRLDRSRGPCRLRLSPEDVVALDWNDEARKREWQDFYEKYGGMSRSDRLYVCGAGSTTFHVDPYGGMSACEMTRFQSYDLRRGSFKDAWQRFIPKSLALRPVGDYPCGDCKLMATCGQCPGWAWLENGDLQTPVEYLCWIAHLRAEVFQWNQ